jgi:hypothetical protein
VFSKEDPAQFGGIRPNREEEICHVELIRVEQSDAKRDAGRIVFQRTRGSGMRESKVIKSALTSRRSPPFVGEGAAWLRRRPRFPRSAVLALLSNSRRFMLPS